MASTSRTQQQLLQIIRKQLFPWVQAAGSHSVILAQPPLHTPPNVRISRHTAPVLQQTGEGRSYFHLTRWREAGLEAGRFPYLGCVVEGEADFIVGQPLQANGESSGEQMVLSAPQRTFLLYPPGVPHEDGSHPHWMRPNPEMAEAKIFWMNILPAGILCHTCTTIRGRHTSQPGLFLRDDQLLPLTRFLMEELETRGANYQLAAQSYLLALLVRLERGIDAGSVLTGNEVPHLDSLVDAEKDSDSSGGLALQRACQYIQSHLNESLSPALVARHAYISTPHLSRLFRLKQGTTIMKYVAHCRIEHARSLLHDTDLPVQEVGRLVGYNHLSHFSHAFSNAVGLSPLEFRKSKQAGPSEAASPKKTPPKISALMAGCME